MTETESESLRVELKSRRGDFELELDEQFAGRGITAVFGPSGSGKSTLLSMIAGFTKPNRAGRISLGSDTWLGNGKPVAVHHRRVAYVMQHGALLPHLSVAGNLAFAAQRAAKGSNTDAISASEAIEMLGIGKLLDRMPDSLSGGQRQRVSICRALLSRPRLLLLDEPLSALDAEGREQCLQALEAMHARAQLPCLYVTHDPDELMRLADRILLLENGKSLGHGEAAQVLADPSLAVGTIGQRGVILQGKLRGNARAGKICDIAIGQHSVLYCLPGTARLQPGQAIRARVHARDVSIALRQADDSSILNCLHATVESVHPQSDGSALLKLDMEGQKLLSLITIRSVEKLALRPGLQVVAQVKGIAIGGAREFELTTGA